MEKEFIPYDRALKLKALGFNEPCFHLDGLGKVSYAEFGYGATPIPLYSQAFRWFREKYDMPHQITYAGAKGRYNAFTDDWIYDSNGELKEFSYEEAELACLDKLIEIIEQKQEEDGK